MLCLLLTARRFRGRPTVTVEQTGVRWEITDQGFTYLIINEDSQLKVFDTVQRLGAGASGANHVYAVPGTFDIDVSVVDTDSSPMAAATGSHSVQVKISDTDVGTTGPYTIKEGVGVTFQAFANSNPQSFAWDLDNDGSFDDAVGATVTRTWSELDSLGIDDNDVYDIKVEATYDVGNNQTQMVEATTTLTVTNVAPTANLSNQWTCQRRK